MVQSKLSIGTYTQVPRHIPVFLCAALFIGLLISSCSSAEEPTAIPTPTVRAPEVVQLGEDAMAGLDSFSFELTHESGHTTLSGALELNKAGGLVTTNGLDLKAEATIGRAFVRVEAVVIDEQTWMTNPLTGNWSEIPPEESPFSFLDPVRLVADILGSTQNAVYPEVQPGNGVLQIHGNIPAEALISLVGSVEPGAVTDVVLSLEPETYRLKKVVITGVAQPEDEPGTIRVIDLTDFNVETTLEPPI